MTQSEGIALLYSQSLGKRYLLLLELLIGQVDFQMHTNNMFLSPGLCPNEAVQGRAAGFVLDFCPIVAPRHYRSGHEGLLSGSRGKTF